MIAIGISVIFALIFVPGNCEGKKLYVYVSKEIDWDSALEFCENKGQQLVTTMTRRDHSQLGHAIHQCGDKCGKKLWHSWTALNDLKETNKYVWAGINQPLEKGFAQWKPNQPDHYQGNEHCVEVLSFANRGSVYLNDRPCTDKFNVICESK